MNHNIQSIKSSFFDEFPDDRKEYEFDIDKFWISYPEYQKIEETFPYFSRNPLIEGILFKKSKKTAWFRNRFFILYQDRLVYYKSDSQYPDKIMFLRGITLNLVEDVVTTNEMEVKLKAEELEKRSFILSRNKHFCIMSAGTSEHYNRWLVELKKCMILTNFSKYYKIMRPIAKGTFAKVVECQKNEDKQLYAVKTLEKSNILNSASAVRSKIGLINEINVLRRLDHPHIVKLYEVYEGKYNIYLVMENMKGGELYNEVVKNGTFSERNSALILIQLLMALDYMHSKGFAHRDIKLENLIFVKETSMDIKIADFGLCESLNKKKFLFKRCGTPGYVAPEILDDQVYTGKCDVFSAGIVLWILLTGFSPFYAKNYQEILQNNKNCIIDFNIEEKYSIKLSDAVLELLKWMLEIDPERRPSAKEAMNHKWFLNNMTENEKKHHFTLQRQQVHLLKSHELKIQPTVLKKSKSIDLMMKTPEFMVPFDSNKIASPIMTPEINEFKMKLTKSEGKNPNQEIKTMFGNDEICVSNYENSIEKEEIKTTNELETNNENSGQPKKYFSSTDLVHNKKKKDESVKVLEKKNE